MPENKDQTTLFAGSNKKRSKSFVRPAFATNTAALFFLVVVAFLLFLPKIMTLTNLSARSDSYELMPENFGAYSYMKNEIFNKDEDIDILFIGASVIWNAVDTPAVEKALSQRLNRPAKVVTFGFNWHSTAVSYALLHDLLERRRVRLIVYSIPREEFSDDGPVHPECKFLRFEDFKEVAKTLPLRSRLSAYACDIVKSPQELLLKIRAPQQKTSPYAKDLGAQKLFLGMSRKPGNFVRMQPRPPVATADELIFSDYDDEKIFLTNVKHSNYHERYLDGLIELIRAKQVSFVMLNVPQYFENDSKKIIENQNWSERFGIRVNLIGIPPSILFAGLSKKEIELLHLDDDHFNVNGSEYFTRTIMPALLEVYENQVSKSF